MLILSSHCCIIHSYLDSNQTCIAFCYSFFFFFFLVVLGLEFRASGALPLELLHQPYFLLFFLR
jgi:hypothetical protein